MITEEYYHIYNRGVEKRTTFLDESDHFRFILGMSEFNGTRPVCHLDRYDLKKVPEDKSGEAEEKLVEIVCYVLMPNHYHLILKQTKENGISKFMQKLGTGYTKYFNKRYQRSGVLFQGVYKRKHIPDDEYLLHLSRYIHLNPLNLLRKDWKEKGIKNREKALEFLMEYKWHSLPFWLDKKPCLVQLEPQIVLDQFEKSERYAEFLMDWVGDDLDKIKVVIK